MDKINTLISQMTLEEKAALCSGASAWTTAGIERVRDQAETVVVVLLSGRLVIIADYLPLADAFVAARLPGTEGQGVVDVLFGDVPFTGRLSFTWSRTGDQLPFNLGDLPEKGCEVPLFSYGYGLTTEEFQPVVVPDCPVH
jgi:beta-glucosidase